MRQADRAHLRLPDGRAGGLAGSVGPVRERWDIMFKRIVSMLFASVFLAGLFGLTAACNTIHGVGQDLEQGGAKIKEEANERR